MKNYIKKIIVCFSIFCFATNAFAAVVSDNDGSAFVTKAEFDALKNSFDQQIYNYNKSIDGKIDGAIASYLSGIKMSNSEDLKMFYDNNWLWNSDSTKTYDSIASKKCWYKAKFFSRTRYETNTPFGADYTYTPVSKKLFYETYEYKTSTKSWEPVKICFRVEGMLHFGRAGYEISAGGGCGGVQWYNFWPDSAKEGEVIQKEYFSGNIYWYTGVTVCYVDYTDGYSKPVVLYPNSTAKTYYYIKGREILNSADKGTMVSDNTSAHWVRDAIPSGFSNSTISNFAYYPDQLVSSETNKAIDTNLVLLKDVMGKSSYNDGAKYGVCLSKVSVNIDDTISVKFIPQTSGEGKIKFAVGENAASAWSTSSIYDSWEYDITSADIGKTVTVEHIISKAKIADKPLFMIYLPSDSNDHMIKIENAQVIKRQ